jgi:type IV secretion system protein VirB10
MSEAGDSSNEGMASDSTPVIERTGSGKIGVIAFAVILGIGGLWIFSLMSTARQQANGSPVPDAAQAVGRIEAVQPPMLPERFAMPTVREDRAVQRVRPVRLIRSAAATPASTPPQTQPAAPVQPAASSDPLPPTPSYQSERPVIVPQPPRLLDPPDPAMRFQQGDSPQGERVRAQRFASPGFTVPLGTIVPAVLETALDSTRSGSARAIVQQDIFGFDGTRVLIPRGSRLYGEYEGDLQPGQNRALVTWTRLMRPDGVTIGLNSAASDQLGRAGIKGKVDSKFFQRFGGALLQSVLDIGVGVASRKASDGVIVALPGSTQNVTRIDQSQITPTLRVKHGTSISVYVARDLDFADVDG